MLATERQSPKTIPAPHGQPSRRETTAPQQRGDDDLPDRAGKGDAPHGKQVADGKMDADAEHEQDDADLGELLRESGIDDDTWREGSDDDAREQVADEGRHAQAHGDEAEQEREAQAGGDRRDQGGLLGHAAAVGGGVARFEEVSLADLARQPVAARIRRQEGPPAAREFVATGRRAAAAERRELCRGKSSNSSWAAHERDGDHWRRRMSAVIEASHLAYRYGRTTASSALRSREPRAEVLPTESLIPSRQVRCAQLVRRAADAPRHVIRRGE